MEKIQEQEFFDEELYYLEECGNDKKLYKHYILGNAHTHVGRMQCYCTEQNLYICASLDEMEQLSEKAKIWIDGFLCGNEPDYPSEDNEEILDHHKEKLIEFRKTGVY